MSFSKVSLRGDELRIFAPFSGIQFAGEGVESYEELEKDPTYLFGFCLESMEFMFINLTVNQQLGFDVEEVELTVEQLERALKVKNGFLIQHDTGWGGSYIMAFGELFSC